MKRTYLFLGLSRILKQYILSTVDTQTSRRSIQKTQSVFRWHLFSKLLRSLGAYTPSMETLGDQFQVY